MLTINTDTFLHERVTVHSTDAFGAGFATVESTGQEAYLPSRVMRASGLAAGTSVVCRMTPNVREPETTRWFAVYAEAETCEPSRFFDEYFLSSLETFMRQGDAWTAEAAAEAMGSPVGITAARLEHLYREQRLHKFVLFHKSTPKGVKVWYTACPERCDVGEFEDEEAQR